MHIPFGLMRGAFGDSGLDNITGADGDLVINNGQTVSINAGDEKHYNSITINSGGVLQVNASASPQPALIGCKFALVNNGVIRAILGQHAGGSFNKTFFSVNYSYSISQQAGGTGGTGFGGSGAKVGGAQNSGNGGQGGGFTTTIGYGENGTPATSSASGGEAGQPTNNGGPIPVYSGNGTQYVFPDSSLGTVYGRCAGGSRGRHGASVILYANEISGSGSVQTYGSAGGSGASEGAFNGGNGGGGGGAGGSGGKIWIRYKKSYSALSYSYGGGSGGAGGIENTTNATVTNGGNGATGATGSIDVAATAI